MLTSDHGGGYDPDKRDSEDICRHMDLNSLRKYGIIKQPCTVEVLIMQPKTLTIHYCPGHPCWVPYRTLNFTKAFQR